MDEWQAIAYYADLMWWAEYSLGQEKMAGRYLDDTTVFDGYVGSAADELLCWHHISETYLNAAETFAKVLGFEKEYWKMRTDLLDKLYMETSV